ncbi:MAG: hypothetical protein HPY73_03125 [Methanomassiliicoccales archaeon]|nr:MAG: hypothetical protein HPY73_03125 [Methanomassiliicoccales archaeon]
MATYDYTINWSGDIRKGTIECANNEDSKREVKKMLKEIGVPKGKYVFVDIVRRDDGKVVIEEELWMA